MSEPSAPDGPIDWEEEEDRVASKYLAAGDPTGWFEELYAAGKSGRITMPFDRKQPHPLLVEWAEQHRLKGAGKNAIVVGCGLGADAEYIASRAFQTTAFDISESAIQLARERHPQSRVDYLAADLLTRRFASDGLTLTNLEAAAMPDSQDKRWRAELQRC